MITSLQNERVKRVVRLRKGRFRRKSGLFVIDGARELARAVASKIEITELFAASDPDKLEPEVATALQQASDAAGEVLDVSPGVMRKLCYGDRDEGFIAVARMPHRSLDDLDPPADALIAVIEEVEKPGNIGGVLRTADGAGVNGVIVAGKSTDLFNPNIIRASLGTVFSLPVCTAEPEAALAWLQARGYQIVTTVVDTPRPYTDVDYRQPTAIVFGSEAEGLSSPWLDSAEGQESDAMETDLTPRTKVVPVRIPMSGIADSLNVSASAAVLLYEARRQRDAVQSGD